jgi:hypothetical protein
MGRIARPLAPTRQPAANQFIQTPAQFESPRSPSKSGFGRFHDRDRFTENGFRHGHFHDRDRERTFFVTPFVALGWPYWDYSYWPYWSYYDDPNDYTLQDPNNDYQVAIPQTEHRPQSESQQSSDHQSENQFYAGMLTALALRAAEHRVGFPQSSWPSQGPYPQNLPRPGQNQEFRPEANITGTPLPQAGAAPSDTSRNLPGVVAASPGQRNESLPKRILLSWFKEGGREVALVEDTESKKVERITAEPNSNHLRIVEVHSDINPQLSEVVISDGHNQETVRFAPL